MTPALFAILPRYLFGKMKKEETTFNAKIAIRFI